jgi:predicted site-specific integrase-resolvase
LEPGALVFPDGLSAMPEDEMTDNKTLKQAASAIGVHWRTVYRWTLEGVVTFIQHRQNGPIFIPSKEIDRICKEKKAPK